MQHLGLRSSPKDIAGQDQLGGGAGLSTAALAVASVVYGYAEVMVARSGTAATNKVLAVFSATLDEENDVEELSDSALTVIGIPEADQVRFVITSANGSPIVGIFNVDYQITP